MQPLQCMPICAYLCQGKALVCNPSIALHFLSGRCLPEVAVQVACAQQQVLASQLLGTENGVPDQVDALHSTRLLTDRCSLAHPRTSGW